MSKRYATLPNCDLCGRFTSDPTELSECRGLGNGYACFELLLCPRCAEHEAETDPIPSENAPQRSASALNPDQVNLALTKEV